MNKIDAIKAMLDGKSVKQPYGTNVYYYIPNRGFRKMCNRIIEPININELVEDNWILVQEPKKRQMTRNEVLAFIEHNNIVTRMHYGAWESKHDYVIFDEMIHTIEYAYINKKGIIGPAMKFEVDDNDS